MVGAYRLGRLDELSADEVPYSGTLFEYKAGFFEALGPALEMGRSFVRPEYQRSPVGLVLLWKGIAKYLQKYLATAICWDFREVARLSPAKPGYSDPDDARCIKPSCAIVATNSPPSENTCPLARPRPLATLTHLPAKSSQASARNSR